MQSSTRGTKEPIDLWGALLFAVALSSLLTVLSNGGEWGWLSSKTLGLSATCAAVSAAFIWLEGRVTSPMVDLSMFKNRSFSSGIGSAVINYLLGSILLFLMPFYLIELRGFSSYTAGLLMSSQALAMVAMAPVSGFLSDRFGSRNLSTAGLALQGISLIMVAQLGIVAPQWAVLLTLVTMGLGTGLFTSPNNNEIMGSAPADRTGLAGSMLSAARTIGLVLGVALGGAVFRGLQAYYVGLGATVAAAFVAGLNGALYTGALFAVLGIVVVSKRTGG